MLPRIAQVFHITMDELFGYTLEYKPLKIMNEYNAGFRLSQLEDYALLDHGTVKQCTLEKYGRLEGEDMVQTWEVSVQLVSNEENFPYTVQKYIKPGCVIDMYSLRLADGKIMDDDKPTNTMSAKKKYGNTGIRMQNTCVT